MSFIKYDLALLVLFVLFVSFFLYKNRAKLKKEGLLFLYKTSWGIKLIDKTAKKFPKTLRALSYVSIGMGYLLMTLMLYLFGRIVYLYIKFPEVVKAVKIPPITPIIPYIDKVVPDALNFPPFYFIYWIIILAIIAISHEFAHGIFMRRYNIHIKSTGFGFFPFFLPIFLAAFVEQDEESMNKASKFQQKAVLAAGTFANILTAGLFFIIMILFFSFSFNPAGVAFDNYAYGVVSLGSIYSMNNLQIDNPTYQKLLELSDENSLNKIETSYGNYFVTKDFLELQKDNGEIMFAYLDAPAINNNLSGAISEIDGIKITSIEKLGETLTQYSPGDKVNIKTIQGEEIKNYEIVLDENPENPEKVWMGITFQGVQKKGFFNKIVLFLSSFKKQNVIYEARYGAADFIYDFIWWLVLISFSVALVNMLPMGIFDGGRFFYLTIWGITKNEKKARKWFGFATSFLLFLLFVLMIFWAFSFV